MNKVGSTPDIVYIISMEPEAVRDSLLHASTEAIQQIAKLLTDTQYEYAKLTLPSKVAQALVKTRLENCLG